MTSLLDVNALVALAWPNHIHHHTMRDWFTEHAAAGWATCSVTESGFVRVSSNTAAIPTARSPVEAIAVLTALREQPGHEFWTDDISLAGQTEIDTARLHGHRQVTDAHLLALTIRRHGTLVTFDQRLGALTTAESAVLTLRS